MLSGLPDEILANIVQFLDVSAIIALNKTAKRFVDLTNEPLLWREFCRSDFRYWDDRKKIRALLADPLSSEWRNLYASRVTTSRLTSTTLKDIIVDTVGRSDKIQAIVEQGYTIKDTLLRLFYESPSSPNHLAQKYWSHVALGCLHRNVALEEWTKIKYRTDVENRTERALAAFDMFILDQQRTGDIDDIFDRLNSYVDAVRQAHPDIDDLSPRQKAITIAGYLREREWLGIHEDREYHSLDNMFLGVAVNSTLRDSLPLVTAVIYCYVCRQFNLRAQPCNYPMHVHALVRPPPGFDLDGEAIGVVPEQRNNDNSNHEFLQRNQSDRAEAKQNSARQTTPAPAPTPTSAATMTSTPYTNPSPTTDLYMDPFRTDQPVPISDLQAQLRFLGLTHSADHGQSAFAPASHRDLITRSARNIINSTTRHAGPLSHPISPSSALYAAYFALVLFPTDPATLRTHLSELTQHFLHMFDHDIHTFRKYVLPLTTHLPDALAYRNLASQLLQSELEPPKPKLRGSHKIFFRVGQVFRHRRRQYLAVIYGWDPTCQMSNQWISMNQVDRLPNGRNQPFYNVLVADDGSTRYVAEENVMLIGREEEGGNGIMVSREEIEGFGIEVGKWFKRFDWGTGRFVSNVQAEYPDD